VRPNFKPCPHRTLMFFVYQSDFLSSTIPNRFPFKTVKPRAKTVYRTTSKNDRLRHRSFSANCTVPKNLPLSIRKVFTVPYKKRKRYEPGVNPSLLLYFARFIRSMYLNATLKKSHGPQWLKCYKSLRKKIENSDFLYKIIFLVTKSDY
jgi:hypothetical protein